MVLQLKTNNTRGWLLSEQLQTLIAAHLNNQLILSSIKWCSQCAQDDIRDTDFAHWHWDSRTHRLLKIQLPPALALPRFLANIQSTVSIKNILSKEIKKALDISLWLSRGVLLKPSPSPHLFSCWTVAILRYLFMCKNQSFRDYQLHSHTAPRKPARLFTTQELSNTE